MTWLWDTLACLAGLLGLGVVALALDRFMHRNDDFNGSQRDRSGR